MEMLEHHAVELAERTRYLIQVAHATNEQAIAFPLARITTCGPLSIQVLQAIRVDTNGQQEAIYGPPDPALLTKKGASTAFTLLSLLASQPGAFANKDWLSEKLGHLSHEADDEGEGLKRVDNVVSLLRFLLFPARTPESPEEQRFRRKLVAYRRASGESGPGYQLAGMPLLWLDVAEIEAHIKRARRLEQFGEDGLVEWQAAYELASQGPFLPGEVYSDWAQGRRQQLETSLWECVQVLWPRFVEQGASGEAEALRILRDYWHSHVTSEDALRPLLELLGKRECFGEAQGYYEQLCAALGLEGKQSDQRTQDIIEFQRTVQLQRKRTSKDSNRVDKREQHIIDLPLRNLSRARLGITDATLFSSNSYLDLETLDRLSSAMQSSSDLDEITLTRLEMATKNHRYEFVQADGRTWYEIFQEMSGHLRIIAQLLERHILHPHLCTIAGETTLLLGDLLFNAGENGSADRYYQSAFETSKGNRLLQAVILGRRALIPIYDHCPQQAIQLIDEAQQMIPTKAADIIHAYLWSVKGEAYASLGEDAACFRALHAAEQLVDRERPGELSLHFQPEIAYATFDRTKFSGYQGICLLRLHRSEPAQDILHDQLVRVEKRALIHQQSIASVDLAVSFVQQASIRYVYEYAANALRCIDDTKSGRVFQRILALRQLLNPWVNSTYVKNLDEYIHSVASDLMKGVQ
jgi:tetratricopeptide (TPR) repeat protein